MTDDWESKFKSWKVEKAKKEEIAKKTESKISEIIIKDEKAVVEEVKQIIEEGTKEMKREVKLHKGTIVILGILIILIILGAIFYMNYNPAKLRYQYIDIEAKNISGLPMNIFYRDNNLFSLSGWESNLAYNGSQDRLFGNEQYKKIVFDDKGKAYTQIVIDDQVRLEPLTSDPTKATKIGWFVDSDNGTINNNLAKDRKEVSVLLSNDKLGTVINYTLFKNKPYFVADFSSQVENESELGDFAYGFVANGFDIYLSNGTILKNDNNVTKIDKNIDVVITGNASNSSKDSLQQKIPSDVLTRSVVKRSGSYYMTDDLDYELFLNNNSQGFIVFSDQGSNKFENLFQWNVFRIYVSSWGDGSYSRAYFIILDNAIVNYDSEMMDWNLSDRYFNGTVSDYISKVMMETSE